MYFYWHDLKQNCIMATDLCEISIEEFEEKVFQWEPSPSMRMDGRDGADSRFSRLVCD